MTQNLLQITIIVADSGQIKLDVQGPMAANELMVLGAIEKIKVAIMAPKEQQPVPSPLLVAHGSLPNRRM